MTFARRAAAFAAALCLLWTIAPAGAAQERDERERVRRAIRAHISADSPNVALSGDAYVGKGEVHEGEMVVIFGDARIDGTVDGEVVVILGSLEINGTVEREVVSVLSRTRLTESAVVHGELVNVGWSMDRDPGSRVDGGVVNINFMSFLPFTGTGGGWGGLLRFIFVMKLIYLATLFVALLIVAALVPRRLEAIAAAFPRKWGWALLVGLAAHAVGFVFVFVLAVSLIGIPLALAVAVALLVVKAVGLAAVLYLVGATAARNLFRREIPHLAAVFGGFVGFALLFLIPFFGWAILFTINILAMGMALLTRLGSEDQAARNGRPVATLPGPYPPPPGAPPPSQTSTAS